MLLSAASLLILLLCVTFSGEGDLERVVAACKDFGEKFTHQFSPDGNTLISPFSNFIALSMLYQGARATTAREMNRTLSYDFAGVTKETVNEEIEELLTFIRPSPGVYKLDIINAVFTRVQYPVRHRYEEILRRYYHATFIPVNFDDIESAKQTINNWVNRSTGGMINNSLTSLDTSSVMVLISVVYFKSYWEDQFSPDETWNATFYNNGVDPVVVPMMSGRKLACYREENRFKFLTLPLKGNNVSMVFVLPKLRNDLTILDKINSTALEEARIHCHRVPVQINIPRFRLEYFNEITENLRSLGMESAFTDGADFTGISKESGLKLSAVIQHARVEVSEEGAQTAGVTGVGVLPTDERRAPPEHIFYADHPFIFYLVDENTGIYLLSGRVREL